MFGVLMQYPGDKALDAGTFDLIGENGKSAHRTYRCEKGERLPLVEVGDDLGIVRWVQVADATDEDAQAA